MEHRKKGRKLKRTHSHRKSLLANLSISLIKFKRIKTTEAKAKELRTYIEPLITKAKDAYLNPEKNVHLRRITSKMIKDREAVQILFNEIGKMVKDRQGGYTRILKTGFRPGDGARVALIEFVDYDIVKAKESKAETKESKKKTEDKGKQVIDQKEVKETAKSDEKQKVKKPGKHKAEKKEKSKDKSEKSIKSLKTKSEKQEKLKDTKKPVKRKKEK